MLERIAHGRPERSLVLTGLRGVGKTVLLNQLRSAAIGSGWGTGKIEARPDQSLRRPVSSALHMALRELRHPDQESMEEVLGVVKAFAQRLTPADAKLRDRWQPGIDVAAAMGRADSGDMEIDLVELLSDAAGLAADVGKGIALFIDEMQDVQPDDVSAICAACHELSQQGSPLIAGTAQDRAPRPSSAGCSRPPGPPATQPRTARSPPAWRRSPPRCTTTPVTRWRAPPSPSRPTTSTRPGAASWPAG